MLLLAAGPACAETLTFGITPLKSASKLAEEWQPLIEEIGRRAGVTLVFRTAPDIPAFGGRLAAGDYDVAYMNPYHYAVYSANPGYRAFARELDRPLTGVIIARRDRAIPSLRDLAGHTLIFPSPQAFAASMLTQAELHRQGIDITARYVQSHDSVLRGVANGGYIAGGTIAKMLDDAEPEIRQVLRVLARTSAYSSHPFTAHPRVSAKTVKKLRAAMLSLSQDETGRELLERIAFKGMEPASDKDYDDIRRLDMSRLIETAR
jgi:phosphonate transport system substrate-binding protein